jgi:hypothetical protein
MLAQGQSAVLSFFTVDVKKSDSSFKITKETMSF